MNSSAPLIMEARPGELAARLSGRHGRAGAEDGER